MFPKPIGAREYNASLSAAIVSFGPKDREEGINIFMAVKSCEGGEKNMSGDRETVRVLRFVRSPLRLGKVECLEADGDTWRPGVDSTGFERRVGGAAGSFSGRGNIL